MRKLSEFDHLSLDERFSGDDWWSAQMKVVPNDNHVAYQLRLVDQAAGLVLGRVTYETFAATWPTMTGDLAEKINSLRKLNPPACRIWPGRNDFSIRWNRHSSQSCGDGDSNARRRVPAKARDRASWPASQRLLDIGGIHG